jgi:hypothetical protein
MAEVNVEVRVSAFPRFSARIRGDRACASAANVAVSPRLSRRSPFPPTSIRHTKPEGEAHAAKGGVPADLPDAEEESLALVDAKVLEEEQKLREERKKAEEASKTEVRQLARSRHRRDGFPFRARIHVGDDAGSFGADARDANRAARGTRDALESTGVHDPAATQTRRARSRRARAPPAARTAQPQISVASTRAVPSRLSAFRLFYARDSEEASFQKRPFSRREPSREARSSTLRRRRLSTVDGCSPPHSSIGTERVKTDPRPFSRDPLCL